MTNDVISMEPGRLEWWRDREILYAIHSSLCIRISFFTRSSFRNDIIS